MHSLGASQPRSRQNPSLHRNLGTHLLLQAHDLEPLKVRELPSPFSLFSLLRKGRLGPFRLDLGLLPLALDLAGAGGSR